jgi:hypothetical protein
MCVRCLPEDDLFSSLFTLHLVPLGEAEGDLRVDVGGGMAVDCRIGF